MPANVPVSGKLFGKSAPIAKSGSSSGPETGPCADDRGGAGESMYDPMPPPHFSGSGVQRRAAAFDAAKQMSAESEANGG